MKSLNSSLKIYSTSRLTCFLAFFVALLAISIVAVGLGINSEIIFHLYLLPAILALIAIPLLICDLLQSDVVSESEIQSLPEAMRERIIDVLDSNEYAYLLTWEHLRKIVDAWELEVLEQVEENELDELLVRQRNAFQADRHDEQWDGKS